MKRLLVFLILSAACTEPPRGRANESTPMNDSTAASPDTAQRAAFLGLRTAKYTVRDLAEAREWYARVLGIRPYFDEPFYVGFNVGGYELGIVPDEHAESVRPESGLAYWGVTSADSAFERLLSLGAVAVEPVEEVGGGIRVGTVRDPFGNLLGVIENPGFKAEDR